MQAFIKRQPVVAAIIFGILGIVILRGTGWLFSNPQPPHAKLVGAYVVIIALTVALLFAFGLGKHLRPTTESAANVLAENRTKKGGFMLGWPMLLIALLLLAMSIIFSGDAKLTAPSALTLILYTLICLGTGVFEEFLCRAGVQNLCSVSLSPTKAVLVASTFFGLMHLLNLIDNPHLIIGTIMQVLYAFCIGVFLGWLYIKTGNIYIPALWHAIFDFFGMFIMILLPAPDPGVVQPDYPFVLALLQLVLIAPLLVIGLRGLKKV